MNEALKLPIKSKANQEVPQIVQQTLLYLWKASRKLIVGSMQVSHNFSRSFVELSREYCADLSPGIMEAFCTHCCLLLVPGTNCTIRLRSRSRRSSRNRKCEAESRVKNEINVRCTYCGTVQSRKEGWGVPANDVTVDVTPVVSPTPTPIPTGKTSQSPSIVKSNGGKPSFSFLNKTSVESLKPPGMLPTGSVGSLGSSLGLGSLRGGGGSTGSLSSLGLGSNTSNNSNALTLTTAAPGFVTPISTPVGSPSSINLLELERSQKKLKRKR